MLDTRDEKKMVMGFISWQRNTMWDKRLITAGNFWEESCVKQDKELVNKIEKKVQKAESKTKYRTRKHLIRRAGHDSVDVHHAQCVGG